ncbi:hypothetical protein Forpi1262_v008204 [Fusarium oxysporum f. sp. raphani]|uniref:Carboxylesterase type B domain-containing protein n=1 Tax=Fusarium oxysporum f. sp. raphani TaxID=96318 RepID=A0A8J5UMI0_FUSOX|nr:hypothetical protein Forpi1262_v008204 [Fusarium oxysporum f. sp. raphani]
MYFYGGGFHSEVIFVTFNYRLGIFRFSGAPGLTQNVAFLDQRLAINAGDISTNFYDFAFYKDPIIAGVTKTTKLLKCSTKSEAAIKSYMQKANPKALFKASQKANKVIISQLNKTSQLYTGITSLFGPTINNKTVFANYTTRVAARKLSRVPAILGFNTDEAYFFTESGKLPNKSEVILAVNKAILAYPLQ